MKIVLKGRALTLLIAAALFFAGNLAFFLAYRSGTQSRRASLQARRDDLRKAVQSSEADAAKVTGQKDRLGGVSEAIDEFYGRQIGTERETLASVVDEIHSILRETGVAVPQISYSTVSVAKLPLLQMQVVFTIRCDYSRFKQLLRAFEASPRWIAVRGIGIARDNDRPGSVQVQMSLVTYFAEPGEPGPAADGAAGPLAARRTG